jgi:hypothetical protein
MERPQARLRVRSGKENLAHDLPWRTGFERKLDSDKGEAYFRVILGWEQSASLFHAYFVQQGGGKR